MVGPADIAALAKQVSAYRSRLHPFVISAPLTPAPSSSPFTIIDWQDLTTRIESYANEKEGSDWLDYVFAKGSYDRGRAFVAELDKWHDELVRLGVKNVPPPMPVPGSEIDLVGAVGLGLAALVLIFFFR